MSSNGTTTSGAVNHQLVWLITGTTSGFGQRLVHAALARGDRVIATARSQAKLDSFYAEFKALQPNPEGNEAASPSYDLLNKKENLVTVQLDITEGEESLKSKVKKASEIWGRIDVLVNNAAVGMLGFVEEGGSARFRQQFESNVFGVIDMAVATLPYLRQSRGTLINVGSRSAWKTSLTGIGAYAASKAAVHAFSETLALEVAPLGVRVAIVAPGTFRTEGMYGQPYYLGNPISDYDSGREASISRFASVPGTERGDPAKAMELLVDLVRGEGKLAGDKGWNGTARYLILGSDAVGDAEAYSRKIADISGEWRPFGKLLQFED
ncbi:NAD(P)-binding protein [Coprinopsis marcescibilis]|uniref:NAD(P)-binding protein n=1 Tax=Coprinopsis marcescibilis TaxID=230819 RepID=A0A5C3KGM9_COPMA|nr:NAD(P)-binding protein [Coprinopsis marcescibilis]